MFITKPFRRFQFNQNQIIHHKIGKIFSNQMAFIEHLYWLLLKRSKSGFFKFNQKCVLIYFLQKSVSKAHYKPCKTP